MKVREFMIRDVVTASPSYTVRDLLILLHENNIGGVPIVDKFGNLIGIISDGDLLRYLAPKRIGIAGLVYVIEDGEIEDILKEKLNTPVKEIMTKRNVISVLPDDEFDEAMHILSRHHFKKLPVVNQTGRVIGIISRGDIIDSITEKLISLK